MLFRMVFVVSVVALLLGCGGGGGSGPACITAADCSAGTYCNFDDGGCGQTGGGTCEAIPSVCTQEVMPVCSCERITFNNECYAGAAAQSIAAMGSCA
jgi:hypothetical protein